MLHDPRAHQALDEFVSEWLRFDRILTSSRDRRRYRQVQPRDGHRHDRRGARNSSRDLVWTDRNFMDAFTAELRLRERGSGGDLRRPGAG